MWIVTKTRRSLEYVPADDTLAAIQPLGFRQTSRSQLAIEPYTNFPLLRKGALASGIVQVFGRRKAGPIHALKWPASEKRQGTKSRWVGHN
jgi:hypothetical protein